MKKTLLYRNLLPIVCLLIFSFIIFGSVFASWSYRYIFNNQRDDMLRTSSNAVHTVSSIIPRYSLDSLDMRMSISILGNISNYDIIVTDNRGTVVACSDGLHCGHLGKTVPGSAIDRAVSGKDPYVELTSFNGLYSGIRYVILSPISGINGKNVVGYVIVSTVPSVMSELWRTSSVILVITALIVMVIAIIVSFATTKHMIRPINEMTRTVRKFAHGDFSSRVHVTSEDELGQLADSFNLMADSLERSENLRREFIANVSHELKTPMTTISGFADGILDGTIPKEREKEYLAVISSETHRLSRLVRNMLNVSQLSSKGPIELRKNSFDISEVICQALLSLEQKITSRGLDVNAELPEEPIMTLGDRDSITQVVYNLLDNAAKFAETGSVIKVSLWKQSGRAYISVENKGETIPENELPLIFDRFHKTDKSRSTDKDGVGLGLYIVKTILDNHLEDIFVTSTDGVTKFTFTLTISPQK